MVSEKEITHPQKVDNDYESVHDAEIIDDLLD